MAERQLIVVVEGTAAMGPYWQTILSDYLEKIIWSFCSNELAGQKNSTPNVELSLITFNTHGLCWAFLVQRSGWTKDVDTFLQWLWALPFSGGGFNDAAIAEGLSEALMMFPIAANGNQTHQIVDGQRHCILVAASNPYPLPTPVYRPHALNLEQRENMESQIESCLSDAETVAKSFPQCSVSLSVICPKQLSKLKEIYMAGKRNPRSPDPPIEIVRNPQFLVLISENFMEAHAALSCPGVPSLAPNQSSADSMPQSKYVKVWEGYRPASAPEILAAHWPQNMQIVCLTSQDHMNNKYAGKTDFLVFRAMIQHGFLEQMRLKNLCAVIQLPSQTLLLAVSEKVCRLIGMLYPRDALAFAPSLHHQQQQQMVGSGMGSGYVPDPDGSQLVSQGQASSQASSNMPGGGSMS
ncbi:hypothetical protein V6N12_020473 [Hibiscus sabdariffa]|uniref:Mediator of RNA polymerase II transcription subunit 25 n=1 Tax=Hibiscus sabdariffa TaxID=183260 RepID=A0ABR2CZ02_9ROSI